MAELNELDDTTRIEIEGYRAGTYLRLEVSSVPYEMVENFDPAHAILVGGLALGEENVGHMQVRNTFLLSFIYYLMLTVVLGYSLFPLILVLLNLIKELSPVLLTVIDYPLFFSPVKGII